MQRIIRSNDVTVTFELDDAETTVLSVQIDGRSRALDISITNDDQTERRITAQAGRVSTVDLRGSRISVVGSLVRRPDNSSKSVHHFPYRIHF